jgi:hypothetical protein
MDLLLTRKELCVDGVFSELTDMKGNFKFVTLEHAYQSVPGTFFPKLPDGVYICARGQHQLHSMPAPFETFEVTQVPLHVGILFHVGNYNADSEGCILLGVGMGHKLGGGKMIVNSRVAFANFMDLQKELDSFTLTVETVS